MAISGCSSCGGAGNPVDQDLQVKTLKAKIDDWSTCPTTDPATKKSIVGRLQAQLDTVTSSIESKQKAKDAEAEKVKQHDAMESDISGVGATLDISA